VLLYNVLVYNVLVYNVLVYNVLVYKVLVNKRDQKEYKVNSLPLACSLIKILISCKSFLIFPVLNSGQVDKELNRITAGTS